MSKNNVYIEVNGKVYDDLTSLKYTKSFSSLVGGFEFKFSAEANTPLPFRNGDVVRIYVNGKMVKKAFVSGVKGHKTFTDKTFTVRGHDTTVDLVDSSIPSGLEVYGTSAKLVDIFNNVLEKLNMTNKVIVEGDIDPLVYEQIVSADIGTTAFTFLSDYCEKAQVFMNSDEEGNIILRQAGTVENNNLVIYSAIDDRDELNNVLESSYDVDYKNQFNKYIVRVQGTFVGTELSTGEEGMDGLAEDPTTRKSRIFEKVSATNDVQEVLQKKAIWQMNINKARSEVYDCVLPDLLDLDVNQLILVKDEHWGLNKKMLIVDLEFSYDFETGSITRITLHNPKGYLPLPNFTDETTPEAKLNENEVIKNATN